MNFSTNRWMLLIPLFWMMACTPNYKSEKKQIRSEIESVLLKHTLEPWYPAAVDTVNGGFRTSFNAEFEPLADSLQSKNSLMQARHLWTVSEAAQRYNAEKYFTQFADHGYDFFTTFNFDSAGGGFFERLNVEGKVIVRYRVEKSAVTHAYAMMALIEYHKATGNEKALSYARSTFQWLDFGARDPIGLGYFEQLARRGTPLQSNTFIPVSPTIDLKDNRSTMHLMEAFASLYEIWPDSLLKKRTTELLLIARDRLVTDEGITPQYFQADWTPISYQDSSRQVIIDSLSVYDRISPGHDVELAYIMLRTMEILGYNDPKVKKVAKQLVDNSIKYAFDDKKGGLYRSIYLFKKADSPEIIDDEKVWWAQAELLNALYVMHHYFPKDGMNYFVLFQKQWEYINAYLIDSERQGWYWSGLDSFPDSQKADKGGIWKGSFHTYRALTNIMDAIDEDLGKN